MKIGIMTWYSYNNYGSKLQATAMCELLKKKNCDATFIKYLPRGIIDERKSFISITKKLISKINFKNKKQFVSNYLFEQYSNRYFKETELCDSYVDLFQLNDLFDGFICGSDQIWSPNNFDPRYFLDFADSSKIIAYAPSIGLNSISSPIIKEKMKHLIARFKHLSIREETGSKIIENMCGIKPEVVLDPTLLLDIDDWNKYENIELNKKLKDKDYVLTYFLGNSDKYLKSILKFAKENHFIIYNIPVYKDAKINKYDFFDDIGPSEFLSLIKNARCVFTDSFHGTIFSINYNVDFYSFKRFGSKSKINQNSRVIDILKRLSLEDRIVEKDLIKKSNILFEDVNIKLKKLRKKSFIFINNALDEIKKNGNVSILNNNNSLNNYCSGCGACAASCPVGAINIEMNKEGFWHYKINKNKCINCGLCKKVCPFVKLDTSYIRNCIKFYSFKACNNQVLSRSSSGGAGYIISSYLNSHNYYVCGCTYNNETDLAEHIIIEPNNVEKLCKLQGSKYLQSFSYDALNKCIEIGKKNKVLFIGTPCQVAGLDKITKIKRIRENFILVDLICHGIPSTNLWSKYLYEIINKYPILKKNHNVIMRDGRLTKRNKFMQMTILDEKNEIIYKKHQEKDLFYAFFNDGTCYDSSCFECPYRTKCSADIRIGDYWGNKYKDDCSGISMVTVMTDNGLSLLNNIKKDNVAFIEEQNIDDYFNAQYPVNRNIPLYRDEMLNDLKDKNISLLTIKNKYFRYQKYIRLFYRFKNKIIRK